MKLFDTSIAIDHLRGRPEATELVVGSLRNGEEVAASELVRFELIAGIRPDEHEDLEDFFSGVGWVPLTEPVARRGGDLAARFRRMYPGIDDVDYLIAATVLELDAEFLTTNVRHFPMLTGLRAAY